MTIIARARITADMSAAMKRMRLEGATLARIGSTFNRAPCTVALHVAGIAHPRNHGVLVAGSEGVRFTGMAGATIRSNAKVIQFTDARAKVAARKAKRKAKPAAKRTAKPSKAEGKTLSDILAVLVEIMDRLDD